MTIDDVINSLVESEAVALALKDAISTYRQDDKTVFVTAERREAWIAVLEKFNTLKETV